MTASKKIWISMGVCLLPAVMHLHAQDLKRPATDSAPQVMVVKDSAAFPQDSVKPADTTAAVIATADTTAKDTAVKAQSPEDKDQGPTQRILDNRWFISPLLKGQFQDFGIVERKRKGNLSDANTLPLMDRGNGSFAASAYKNISNRLSISADLGLSFGHVTNDSVLISQTKTKTFNLLNATIYYHLLNPSYAFQPFISLGINDIVCDETYITAPLGVGVKFNSRKIMMTAQVAYGYAVKNMASNTIYSLGIYIPIANKKKAKPAEDSSAYNRLAKKDSSKGGIVNNFYITINLDSLSKAKKDNNGLDGGDSQDGSNGNGSGGKKKKKNAGTGAEDGTDNSGKEGEVAPDPSKPEDSRIDTVNGRPVYRFYVYFEFNQYALNSKAFSTVDMAIATLKAHAETNITIDGYTDDIGTVHQNDYISRKRSQMVFEYLNTRGVGSERMTARHFGKDNPVASNDNPNTAWLNRRVEIVVQDR